MKTLQHLPAILIIPILLSCTAREKSDRIVIHELNEKEIPKGDKIIALVGGTLIDGLGGEPLQNACLIIKNDKIEAVGKAGDIPIPKEAETVDVKGMTVLPGLIDAHYHNEASVDMAPLYLSHGITSVRDPGAWIEAYGPTRASGKPLPRLFLAGPHLTTYPPAYPADSYIVQDAEECRLAVHRLAGQGATVIKVYFGLSIGMIKEICTTAHGYGLPVTAHLETANAQDAIEAGVDGIEHITSFGTCLLPLREAEKYRQRVMSSNEARNRGRYEVWNSLDLEKNPFADSLIRFLSQKKTFVTPTLTPFEKHADLGDSVEVNGFRNMMKFVGKAKRGGVRMVVGSHTWGPYAEPGFAYFHEIELFREAGLSNMEIIQAATIENARFFRIDERLGSLEKGKIADLIIVEGDPIKDIKVLRQAKRVMLNGSWVPVPLGTNLDSTR
jgi:imidazolonepropionase-like amidohydrolase